MISARRTAAPPGLSEVGISVVSWIRPAQAIDNSAAGCRIRGLSLEKNIGTRLSRLFSGIEVVTRQVAST